MSARSGAWAARQSAGRSRRRRRGRRSVVTVLGWVLLALVLLIALFPVYFMALTSLHPPRLGLGVRPTLISTDLSLRAFRDLLGQNPFATWMRNTLFVALTSTALAVLVSALAAYSLARLRYPGRRAVGQALFAVYLVPSALLFVPVFVLLSDLGLLDTFAGLIGVHLTFAIPFCVWMLRAYFLGIPRELEDAARVDGATRLQVLRQVVLPLAKPGLAAAAVYTFTLSWNEYLYAFILLNSSDRFTLAPGMTKLVLGDVFLWGQIMAGGVLMSLPVLLLYFLAQRFLVTGLTAGAVKG